MSTLSSTWYLCCFSFFFFIPSSFFSLFSLWLIIYYAICEFYRGDLFPSFSCVFPSSWCKTKSKSFYLLFFFEILEREGTEKRIRIFFNRHFQAAEFFLINMENYKVVNNISWRPEKQCLKKLNQHYILKFMFESILCMHHHLW